MAISGAAVFDLDSFYREAFSDLAWLFEDEEPPASADDFRRLSYGPAPRPAPPRFSPVMAACMLWVGAQQSGLSSRNDMTSNTLHGKA